MFGFHTHKKGLTYAEAIKRDLEIGKRLGVNLTLCQIFVVGPRNSIPIRLTPALKELDIDIYAHGAYIDNTWGNAGAKNIIKELEICKEYNIKGLVIHTSSKTLDEFDNFLSIIDSELANDDYPTLYLENHAAKSSANTFELPQKFKPLINKINIFNESHKLHVGLCIDTAHLASSGNALTTYEDAKYFFEKLSFNDIIIHLNDSEIPIGKGSDKHYDLGKGTIWGNIPLEDSGISYIVNMGIPCIMERNDTPIDNDICVIKKLTKNINLK